ncbi:MAG TPA: amidohydrolase, partial [Xanthomonadaceae bacterium]|nr:amidohydrolase [Xanthomonadaceae bacterium]
LQPARRVAFETDEGTWMSLDVSPDGKHLVFDLLGDLYALDSTGGRATPITRGMAFDAQPAYSPDGRWIAYVSDASGAENLWIVRPDGGGARQVSFGDDDSVLASPAWAPDGGSVYISRYRWSLNAYELWRYGLDGSETLLVPIKAAGRRERWSSLGAVASPDGSRLYFARSSGEEDSAGVALWSIVRRDVASGEEETLLPEPGVPGRRPFAGSYFRPALSPDGQWLAYATRSGGRTGLRLRHLDSGADRWLAFPIEHDQSQARSWQDLVPRYAFTADGAAVVLSRNGKLERLPLDPKRPAQPLPFTAAVDLELGPLTRVDIREDTGPVRARLIQDPQASPDGGTLAFSALGRLYLMALDGSGVARQLDTGGVPAFHPSWSPDGAQLTYVTWDGERGGQVWVRGAAGGAARALSEKADYYTHPLFTRDGREVLSVHSDNRARMQASMVFGSVRDATLLAFPVDGGPPRRVYAGKLGGTLHFGADPRRVIAHDGSGAFAIDLSSGKADPALTIKGPGWYFQDGPVPVDDIRISPDGKWALASVAQQLHLLPAPAPGATLDLSAPGVAHRRITDVGADYFGWSQDGRTIAWAIGSTWYRRALDDVRLNPAGQPDWSADAPDPARGVQAFEAVVELPRDRPQGSLLLRGGTALTMRGDEAIEHADVLVRDGRIAAIGARGSFALPAGTEVRDVSGRFLLPGFIDIHDHVADVRRDLIAMDSWGLRARLAYGVTTAFDPSSLSIDYLAYQDLVDAGLVAGSRAPTTGMAVFSFNRLASLDEARALLRRYRDHYRTRNLKQYLVGNRRQRQWLVQAAAEAGVMPTAEGSLAMKLDLSQVLDGYAGNEHSLATPVYRDVVELIARSGTSYDTTLQIANGGPPAQDALVVRDRPLQDAKFMRTRPYAAAMEQVQSRRWVDPALMLYPRLAADAARIQRAGGVVGMGSHGEIPGIGFHWELEAHVQGGMTPMQALRAGTLGSATAIGRAAEFGSLEPGKFADLLVLSADPRRDIGNTRALQQVMKNGRLYAADDLAELWPQPRPPAAPWFDGEYPQAR